MRPGTNMRLTNRSNPFRRCALDGDDSNMVQLDELAGLLKGRLTEEKIAADAETRAAKAKLEAERRSARRSPSRARRSPSRGALEAAQGRGAGGRSCPASDQASADGGGRVVSVHGLSTAADVQAQYKYWRCMRLNSAAAARSLGSLVRQHADAAGTEGSGATSSGTAGSFAADVGKVYSGVVGSGTAPTAPSHVGLTPPSSGAFASRGRADAGRASRPSSGGHQSGLQLGHIADYSSAAARPKSAVALCRRGAVMSCSQRPSWPAPRGSIGARPIPILLPEKRSHSPRPERRPSHRVATWLQQGGHLQPWNGRFGLPIERRTTAVLPAEPISWQPIDHKARGVMHSSSSAPSRLRHSPLHARDAHPHAPPPIQHEPASHAHQSRVPRVGVALGSRLPQVDDGVWQATAREVTAGGEVVTDEEAKAVAAEEPEAGERMWRWMASLTASEVRARYTSAVPWAHPDAAARAAADVAAAMATQSKGRQAAVASSASQTESGGCLADKELVVTPGGAVAAKVTSREGAHAEARESASPAPGATEADGAIECKAAVRSTARAEARESASPVPTIEADGTATERKAAAQVVEQIIAAASKYRQGLMEPGALDDIRPQIKQIGTSSGAVALWQSKSAEPAEEEVATQRHNARLTLINSAVSRPPAHPSAGNHVLGCSQHANNDQRLLKPRIMPPGTNRLTLACQCLPPNALEHQRTPKDTPSCTGTSTTKIRVTTWARALRAAAICEALLASGDVCEIEGELVAHASADPVGEVPVGCGIPNCEASKVNVAPPGLLGDPLATQELRASVHRPCAFARCVEIVRQAGLDVAHFPRVEFTVRKRA